MIVYGNKITAKICELVIFKTDSVWEQTILPRNSEPCIKYIDLRSFHPLLIGFGLGTIILYGIKAGKLSAKLTGDICLFTQYNLSMCLVQSCHTWGGILRIESHIGNSKPCTTIYKILRLSSLTITFFSFWHLQALRTN